MRGQDVLANAFSFAGECRLALVCVVSVKHGPVTMHEKVPKHSQLCSEACAVQGRRGVPSRSALSHAQDGSLSTHTGFSERRVNEFH